MGKVIHIGNIDAHLRAQRRREREEKNRPVDFLAILGPRLSDSRVGVDAGLRKLRRSSHLNAQLVGDGENNVTPNMLPKSVSKEAVIYILAHGCNRPSRTSPLRKRHKICLVQDEKTDTLRYIKLLRDTLKFSGQIHIESCHSGTIRKEALEAEVKALGPVIVYSSGKNNLYSADERFARLCELVSASNCKPLSGMNTFVDLWEVHGDSISLIDANSGGIVTLHSAKTLADANIRQIIKSIDPAKKRLVSGDHTARRHLKMTLKARMQETTPKKRMPSDGYYPLRIKSRMRRLIGRHDTQGILRWLDAAYDLDLFKTLLHEASRFGAPPSMLEALINAGLAVNGKDDDGMTPLHFVCTSQETLYTKIFAARTLIARMADVNSCSSSGQTPLHLAVSENCWDLVDLLLKSGAEVDVRTQDGTTPLHTAAKNGRQDIVKLLLGNGASPTISDNWGRTALHQACRFDAPLGIIDQLRAKGASVGARDSSGVTPLMIARDKGNKILIDHLLGHAADPSRRDE